MVRKKKELKKVEKDDRVDVVDLTKSDALSEPPELIELSKPIGSIEPIKSAPPMEPTEPTELFELIEPVEPEPIVPSTVVAPAELEVTPTPERAIDSQAAQEFKAKTTLAQDAFRKTFDFVKDQKVLVDAFLVAVSFHVVMFPVLWTAGWALPWPKPPVVTTLMDYDLQEWIKTRKPKTIIEFRDPALNE